MTLALPSKGLTMLNARVRNIVSNSSPQDSIVFIVEVNADQEMSQAREISDIMARKAALREVSSRAKAPVINALNAYEPLGLKVVNPMNGSLQLIAQGPAAAWEQAIGEHSDLFDGQQVDLLPNEANFAAI